MIDTLIISAAMIMLFLMLLSLYRVIGGPTVLDRILGGNIVGTKQRSCSCWWGLSIKIWVCLSISLSPMPC